MSSGLRYSARVAIIVAFVSMGLFTMHTLVAPDGGALAYPHAAGHATMALDAAVAAPSSALTDVGHMAMDGHAHDLLACLALLATAVACCLSIRFARVRRVAGSVASPRWWWTRGSQRAPPLSVRLALVGLSRR